MTKRELIDLMVDFDDDAIIDVYVRDHYRGFDGAELSKVTKCPFVDGNFRLIVDLKRSYSHGGSMGSSKITFRKS